MGLVEKAKLFSGLFSFFFGICNGFPSPTATNFQINPSMRDFEYICCSFIHIIATSYDRQQTICIHVGATETNSDVFSEIQI